MEDSNRFRGSGFRFQRTALTLWERGIGRAKLLLSRRFVGERSARQDLAVASSVAPGLTSALPPILSIRPIPPLPSGTGEDRLVGRQGLIRLVSHGEVLNEPLVAGFSHPLRLSLVGEQRLEARCH